MFLFSFKDLLSTTIYKVLVFIGGIINSNAYIFDC